jgi:DNA polymerase-3 subunit beta
VRDILGLVNSVTFAPEDSEFVKIAFTNNDNPNKPGPVLISSHGAKEKTDSDSYRYLLQPNLLVR